MKVTLTIDGKKVSVEGGQTILDAARANDIYIPTLCDYPGLKPHGSCRICIVDVQGRPNTPTACTTPVAEGMIVETNTPQIQELRLDLLRMLLADHPSGCLFCPENTNCEECMVTLRKTGVTTGCRSCPMDQQCQFQDVIKRSGLTSVAYPVRYRALPVERQDPFFDRNYNLCILCGRCIHVCESLHFTNILSYVDRGSQSRVGTSFGQSHVDAGCSFCGACVDVCPTGSLSEKTRKWEGKPGSAVPSTCAFCSLGCDLNLLTGKNGSERIIGSQPAEVGRHLCVFGRFAVSEMVNHPSRLKDVLHVEEGKAVRSGWDEAIDQAARRLSDCAASDFGMVVSATSPSEDLYVAAKFAREVMGSPAILNAAARYGKGLESVSRLLNVSQSLDVLEEADLIFCLGLDMKYGQSVVEIHLKRALARGAKVITLNAQDHVPGRFATLWLKPKTGNESEMMDTLLIDPTGGPEAEAARLLKTAGKPVLVIGPDILARMPEAVEQFAIKSGAAVVAIAAEANLNGALRLGLGSTASTGKTPRILFLIGAAVPTGLNPETLILYQNTHKPAVDFYNGWQLPMAGYGETAGTVVDQSGKAKHLAAAVAAGGDALPGWEILCRIARAMGKPGFEYSSVEEIAREVSGAPVDKSWKGDLPSWVSVPEEHDFLGADLSAWVAGLQDLPNTRCEEEYNVQAA